MNYNNAVFIKSAADKNNFIRDGLPQIVFAGRSNVGKSSVINRLLNRKNFARSSSVPGKTAHINYFLIDACMYFVDLPGYGYAKVSMAEKRRWARLMDSYFSEPGLITAGTLIVDARHTPTEDDVLMADWFKATGCPLIVVANKIDKVKKNRLEENLLRVSDTLKLQDHQIVIPFSAEKGDGRKELLAELEKYNTGAI
ncbi:MAG: YihA family ribosome biogenesis GTP-binding protein [Clostridiales bacterium]|nr:YihA family ribosome biogenesis GTP-binding protein [Clostridiales bacterium]